MDKPREYLPDSMKALGILLVVMGHTSSPFNDYIYSFHMGLFFWVTGYLFYPKRQRRVALSVRKAVKGSWLPFFLFWCLSAAAKLAAAVLGSPGPSVQDALKALVLGGSYLNAAGMNPSIWYLQLNCIAVICFALLMKLPEARLRFSAAVAVALVTVAFQQALPEETPFKLGKLPEALVFMYCGAVFAARKDSLPKSCLWGIPLVLAGVLLFGVTGLAECGWGLNYLSPLCTITGLYFLLSALPNVRFIRYTGRMTLYGLGLHMYFYSLAFFLNNFLVGTGVFHPAVANVLVAAFVLALCFAVAEVYFVVKRFVLQRLLPVEEIRGRVCKR